MLIRLRSDIENFINRGEATLVIFIDYSKAFDTIALDILLHKMHKLNFGTDFLHLTTSFLYSLKHFVQINTDVSTFLHSSLECLRDQSLDPYYLTFVLLIVQVPLIVVNVYDTQTTL